MFPSRFARNLGGGPQRIEQPNGRQRRGNCTFQSHRELRNDTLCRKNSYFRILNSANSRLFFLHFLKVIYFCLKSKELKNTEKKFNRFEQSQFLKQFLVFPKNLRFRA